MTDYDKSLGFPSNTEHKSSEPTAWTGVPKSSYVLPGLDGSKCKCGRKTVMRMCLTHKKIEFFEPSNNFRGTHNFLDDVSGRPGPRYAEVDRETRGSWRIHECVASQKGSEAA